MIRNRLPLTCWKVSIAAHPIEPRWFIPARTVRLPAPDEEFAAVTAIRESHALAGVPAWRPLIRTSREFTTVSRTMTPTKMKQHDPRQAKLA